MSDPFSGYEHLTGPDEMFAPDGSPRPAYHEFASRLGQWSIDHIDGRQRRSEMDLLASGITFTVYQDEAEVDRIFPFSIIPRIVAHNEWTTIETGLQQRVKALNAFLHDVYHDQRCVTDGVIPGEVLFGAAAFNMRMVGFEPPQGVYTHIAGSDLIRDQHGEFRILEDNVRTPSGVSYVLENRRVMLEAVPELFPDGAVSPVTDYPEHLLEMLIEVRPEGVAPEEARIVILTPGSFNSAYFEHTFLAQQMGVDLVEGRDLIVHDQTVYLRSTTGLERVDVIYKRVDDEFLDPLAFRPDSVLGVAGLADAYRAGNVTLANAMGVGVADDKVVYRFVPDFIRYYLGEEPILRNIETLAAVLPEDLEQVCAHLDELVVKPAGESGGYGLVVGPQASDAELRGPRGAYPRQPAELDRAAAPGVQLDPDAPRRPVAGTPRRPAPIRAHGADTWVLPGGLTRVALVEGSYVVNSSQGGGSKDTWVLRPPRASEA